MRLIFEPATVALACQRATEEELLQIRRKAERMERIALAGGDWPLADQEFHMAIIKASHNEYMRRLYPIINGAVNEILQVDVNREHMQSIAISDNYMILDFPAPAGRGRRPPRHEHPHPPPAEHAEGIAERTDSAPPDFRPGARTF